MQLITLNRTDCGVIFSEIPDVPDNWSRRNFLAVLEPGTEVSVVVQVPQRLYDSSAERYVDFGSEETEPLLRMDEAGIITYLHNADAPYMGTDALMGLPNWMDSLNKPFQGRLQSQF